MHIGYIYYKCIQLFFTNPDNNSSNYEETVENVFLIILYIYNFIFLLIAVVPILFHIKDNALYYK